jgi:exodeoxyribonuclease VII small subunit
MDRTFIPMDTAAIPYSQAMNRLQALVAKLEEGQQELDEMLADLAEAEALVSACRLRLHTVSTSVDDLVTKLTSRA